MTKIAASVALACGLLATGCNVYTPPSVPIAPAGARVTGDAEAGYRTYARSLVSYGAWEPDRRFGARWCPNGVEKDFVPFASRGHWALSNRTMGSAKAHVPMWIGDDASWGDITYHHGFWTRTDTAHASGWCWIPGVEETPARVVWREGGGFIGWAPEEPDTRVGDDVDFDELYWFYQTLASLLDPVEGGKPLHGDAKKAAEYATWRHPVHHVSHVGPPRVAIEHASRLFEGYRAAHPEAVGSEGIERVSASPTEVSSIGKSSGESVSSGSSGSKSSSSSSGSSAHVAKVSSGSFASGGNVKVVDIGGLKIVVVSDVYMMPQPMMPLDLPPPEYLIANPARDVAFRGASDARLPGSEVGDRYVASRTGGRDGASAAGVAANHAAHGHATSHGHSSGHAASSAGKGVSFGHGLFHFHR